MSFKRVILAGAAALAMGATAGTASAAPGIGIDAMKDLGTLASPVEKAQSVFWFGGRRYCFYWDGWQGPGWYWCGYAWRRGYGWGGAPGWHGWKHPHRGHHKGPIYKGPIHKGPIHKGPIMKGPKGPIMKGPVMKGPVMKGGGGGFKGKH